jgi:hypothetical protein
MTADIVHADNPALARHARKTTPAAALGIVYGDLGTSPLYTLQAIVSATGGHFSPAAALGSLSLSDLLGANNHHFGQILPVRDARRQSRRRRHPGVDVDDRRGFRSDVKYDGSERSAAHPHI